MGEEREGGDWSFSPTVMLERKEKILFIDIEQAAGGQEGKGFRLCHSIRNKLIEPENITLDPIPFKCVKKLNKKSGLLIVLFKFELLLRLGQEICANAPSLSPFPTLLFLRVLYYIMMKTLSYS